MVKQQQLTRSCSSTNLALSASRSRALAELIFRGIRSCVSTLINKNESLEMCFQLFFNWVFELIISKNLEGFWYYHPVGVNQIQMINV